jgi:hypothetical protein
MKRALCTSLVVMAFATIATAQDSTIWLDARSNAVPANTASNYNAISAPTTMNGPFVTGAPAGTGGKRGGGQVLRINPIRNNGAQNNVPTSFPNLDGDGNRATGDLWVYMDVADDTSGTNDVISSVGIDFDLTFTGTTTRYAIGSIAYTANNDGSVLNSITNPTATPWNGVVNGTQVVGNPPDWTGAKAVAVPVTTGPVYASTNRLIPNVANFGAAYATSTAVPYRLGKLRATAALRNCATLTGALDPAHATNSQYNVFLKVNNLLITRVYETLGDAVENVSFGINAGGTPDAAVSGSTSGAVSAVADAIIAVREKGDFSGDGRITGADNTLYTAASGNVADNVLQDYAGDFNVQVSVGTINNLVTGADNGGYLAAQAGWSGTVCP